MKKRFKNKWILCVAILVAVGMITTVTRAQQSVTTLILLRHAEKELDGGSNPELAATGVERANRLTSILQHQTIQAIYSTDFKRTISTVQPLADDRSVPVKIYESFKENELFEILDMHAGGTVVVVGHSNSIPLMLNLLTGSTTYSDLSDDEYDKVFIVDVISKGKLAKVTVLSF
jgi:broad specificity phosphatase PhoE